MTVDAAIEAFLDFYAEDVVCYPAPGWIEGDGVCHGHDGFRRLAAVWTGNIDDGALEVHEVRDLGERVLVLAEFTGRSRASGEPRSQRFGAINSHLRGDGKVREVRFYLTWLEARDAVGLVH
jgi:ketosteroid isomerase-like protein